MHSLETLLAIFQQTEYDPQALKKWAEQHTEETMRVTPDSWTPKLTTLKRLTTLFFFLPPVTRIIAAHYCLLPLDWLIKTSLIWRASLKLRAYQKKGLRVVAIAGSYGKTSTKHIVSHVLQAHYSVLATPKSVNVKLGIAQIINEKLTTGHQIFVVEMGEYTPGDIAAMTNFVQPDFGIITPIGPQHLERFGTLAAIAQEIGQLATYCHTHQKKPLLAAQNQSILDARQSDTYGDETSNTWSLSDIKVSRRGTEYSVFTNNSLVLSETFIPLYGTHQAVNTLPAYWLATHLAITPETVASVLRSVPYVPRRHQPHFVANDILILDNSYNTNPDSILASLQLLQQLEGSRKIVVTLGLVELGQTSTEYNRKLGKQLAVYADVLGLIAGPDTEAIATAYQAAGGVDVVIGKTQHETLEKLQAYILPRSVILLEGGAREIYQ